MDRRWQMVLDCLDTNQSPFSKGTFVAFRRRLIDAQMDRRLIERTMELASHTEESQLRLPDAGSPQHRSG
jgi:transposase